MYRKEFFEWLNTCPTHKWNIAADEYDHVVITFPTYEDDDEPIQDSNVKYYIANIEERIGDHQPTTNIRFKTEGDPQAYLADIVKGFYGDEPNEDEPNSGVYWNETMEKVCYAGGFTEVSKDIFETVSSHLSNMTGYGFSERGVI